MGREPANQPRLVRSRRVVRLVLLTGIFLSVVVSGYLGNLIPAIATMLAWGAAELYVYFRNASVARMVKAHHGFLCTSCGYDLRQSPGEGRCPECGAEYSLEETWRTWRAWLDKTPSPSGAIQQPPYVRRFRWASVLSFCSVPLAIALGAAFESVAVGGVAMVLTFLVLLGWVGWKSSRVMESAQAANFLLCPHCAYDLSGCTASVCSECGKPFEQVHAQAAWRDWCMGQ